MLRIFLQIYFCLCILYIRKCIPYAYLFAFFSASTSDIQEKIQAMMDVSRVSMFIINT